MKPANPSDLTTTILGASPERRLTLLKAVWPAAVGPDLARRSEVVALDGEVLRIRVPDGSWRKNLWAMRSELLRRLRKIAGKAAPHVLGFVEGPVSVAAREGATEATPPPPVSPLPDGLEEAAAGIPDDGVRELFKEAAGRYLARFGENPQETKDRSD